MNLLSVTAAHAKRQRIPLRRHHAWSRVEILLKRSERPLTFWARRPRAFVRAWRTRIRRIRAMKPTWKPT